MRISKYAVLLASAFLLGAAPARAQAPPALAETRPFFQDVEGYHAQGQAEAADRVEAQRLAKAAALRRLFTEIGKDVIFAEMTISGWPEYITVEETVTLEREGGTLALVQVSVGTSAIMLTEQKYQVAAADLLDRTELSLQEAERALSEADEHERNLRVPEALVAYRSARGRVAEARLLSRDVGDRSVVSSQGNNIAGIGTRLDALSLRVSGGLERMEAIEREASLAATADEMTKAYELYQGELESIEAGNQENLALSPFYDLPKAHLEAILLDLQADAARDTRIAEELTRLLAAVPAESAYLRQKAELSLADANTLGLHLERMIREVRDEIRLPRLVQQERTQRRRATLAALGAGLRYAFLHKPTDTVSLVWALPLVWDMESPIRGTGEANLSLEAEGLFSGLWVRGSIGHEDIVDDVGPQTWKSSAWTSSFDLGFGRSTVLGLGVVWDWYRAVGDPALGGERELGVRLHVGGVDAERGRVGWLIGLEYTLPLVPATVIVLPYHLNARATVRIKAADVLLLRARLATKSYQNAALGQGVDLTRTFSYRFDWSVGLGLRLPPPFILGLSYGGQVTAALGPQGLESADRHAGGWGLSLGYVF